MKRPRMVGFAAAVAACWIGAAGASAVEPQKAPAPPEKPIRLFAEVQFTTAYYYRGFVQETDGLIVQPAFRGELDLFRDPGGEGLQRVSAVLAIRNSLHSEHTGADGNGPDIWYEADVVAGLNFKLHDRWEFEALYASITSPNGAWDSIREIDLIVAYNDAGLWGSDFSLRPYAKTVIELDGSAAGGEEGIYLELGIEPGFPLVRSRDFPVLLSFPIRAGLSLSDFYVLPFGNAGDDTFGYLKAGVSFTMPLTFVPRDYGQWALIAGADVIYLGDNLQTLNRGEDTDVMGRIGIGARF